MAQKVNLEVKGVIENMAWFTGDDGKRYELFGGGGGAELAERLEVPLLGQVPLVPALREGGDDGPPIVAIEPDGEAAQRVHGDRRAHRRRAGADPALPPRAQADLTSSRSLSTKAAPSLLFNTKGTSRRSISLRTNSPATPV